MLTVCSVYTGLTALVIHMYQLHTMPEADLLLVQRRTWISMQTMQRLAEVWLVAKMVHQVFKTVLELSGLSDCLDERKVFGRKDVFSAKTTDLIALSKPNSNSVVYAQPLTPALKEQLNVYVNFLIPRPQKKSRARLSSSRPVGKKEDADPEKKTFLSDADDVSKKNYTKFESIAEYVSGRSLPLPYLHPDTAGSTSTPDHGPSAEASNDAYSQNYQDPGGTHPIYEMADLYVAEVENLLNVDSSTVHNETQSGPYDTWLSNAVPGPPVPSNLDMDAWYVPL